MMVRPTTEQLLLDCCTELIEGVLPAVTDQTAVVRIFMIEQVLRNAAVRSAHEIEWMTGEIPALVAFAEDVQAAAPTDELAVLLARVREASAGLALDKVIERYSRAGQALATALETTITGGLTELRQRGEALLDARHEHETAALAGWNPTGR